MPAKTSSADNSPLPPANSIHASSAMNLNAVQVLEDSDYRYAKALCDDHTGWTLAFERKCTQVWTRRTMADSPLQMIKVRGEYHDVPASLCYEVLHDTEYRHKWDKHVLHTVPVGYLNPNNDICYYALGGLPPFKSRDFVLLRSWLDVGDEKFILAHSVWHDRFPPNKSHIRGIVHLTVHFVRPLRKNEAGCEFNYVTLADPRGKLPKWLTNHATRIIAPKLVKKLHKACLGYVAWRRKHGKTTLGGAMLGMIGGMAVADYPRVELAQCVPKVVAEEQEELDETGVAESSNGKRNDDEEEEEEAEEA